MDQVGEALSYIPPEDLGVRTTMEQNQRWLQSIQALTKVTDTTIGAPLAYAAVLRHPLHLRSAYANECPVFFEGQ